MESSFLMASWLAPFSAQPHGIPKVDDRMGNGPLVGLSYLRVNGYSAEVERTYFHTTPSTKEKKVYRHMLKARDLAVSMVRPGVVCGDIDQTVYNYLVSKGYENNILHRTGHGIG
jgi:Xaa-Pro dipeptidase